MHKLLQRQLQRHLGGRNSLPDPWASLVEAVNEAYEQADADRALLERSLELTSQELVQRNAALRQDILERQRAAEALRESQERFKSAFGYASIGMALVGTDGRWLQVNRALCDIVGYTEDELLATTFQAITHPDDLEADLAYVRQMLAGDIRTYQMEKRYLHKQGHVVWILLSVSLVHNPKGQPLYFIAQIQDITDRKRAEDAATRHSAELARSNAELQQFAYVASHDLQEPLRMVESYTQLIARRYKGKLGTDADEFLAFIVGGVTRMQALINDLLAYSRVGTQAKPFKPTDCEAVMKTVLANLQAAIHEQRAVVTHDQLPTLMSDALQLGQVLQNLISNAIKFHGEPPPHVHVGAQRQRHEWLFTVRDNGIGIEPQYFERIFVIFQRLHSREEYPGTGIGLAICKKIVERHGGRIWVESKPGEGTTFCFTIPDVPPKPEGAG